jgi:hypothetical protein
VVEILKLTGGFGIGLSVSFLEKNILENNGPVILTPKNITEKNQTKNKKNMHNIKIYNITKIDKK